jgi:phospholipid/cholesterol/gamma-HCH transport system ATP-binding protein
MTIGPASLIRFEHAWMQFAQPVLRDICLEILPGQTVAVIGESGCGKTVLLKLMIGLLRPTVGRVLFDGQALIDLPDREQTRQRTRFGFLFQGAALFDSLTVFDNIALGLREKSGLDAKRLEWQVMQRLREVGLQPGIAHCKPAELSGGMKKRVGLARALALEPEVMLYDEPTTGLDPIMSDVINELILQTRRQHPVTSIVVTHDMRTVHKVADRVVMLYPLAHLAPGEGQVLFDGPPDKLARCPDRRVAQFIEGQARGRLLEG